MPSRSLESGDFTLQVGGRVFIMALPTAIVARSRYFPPRYVRELKATASSSTCPYHWCVPAL